MDTTPGTARRRAFGLLGVVALLAVVALAVGAYRTVFTPVVMVTLTADRAGLLMEPGADVRLRGLPVGEVRTVEPDGGSAARLVLALDTDSVAAIPAQVTAELVPTTVFGPKVVTLTAPGGAGSPIRAGDVIRTAAVTTEINDVFAALQDVLTTVEPSKISATLGAVATTLEGRGQRLGDYVVRLDGFLRELEPSLPALQTDITGSADVLASTAELAPDLLRLLDAGSTTARTLSSTQATLHATLLDLTTAATDGQRFLDTAGPPLITALDALAPVTRLLAEYSPGFTCTVSGLNVLRRGVEATVGNTEPGLQALLTLLPGQQGYTFPRDLPTFVGGDGPDCFGLPVVDSGVAVPPRVRFDDGNHAYDGDTDALSVPVPPVGADPEPLVEQLFGVSREEVPR